MRIYSWAFLFCICLSAQTSIAATTDDYLTCGLMYGALFKAAKDSQDWSMIGYTRPRLKAVLPFLEKIRGNPETSERLKVIASRLKDDVKVLVKRATEAIRESDEIKLKAALSQVFRCDGVFGLQSFPLPLSHETFKPKNKFAQGFYEGCLAKKQQNPGPFSNAQILQYCKCMTDTSVARGMSAQSSDDETAEVIKSVHKSCFNQIRH